MAITCRKCGTPKRVRKRARMPKGRLSRTLFCPACEVAAVMRYRARHPERVAAHRAVLNAKRRGRLKPKPCEVCGSTEAIEAHHDDYQKPLVVRWLCRKHHRAHHRNPPGGTHGRANP